MRNFGAEPPLRSSTTSPAIPQRGTCRLDEKTFRLLVDFWQVRSGRPSKRGDCPDGSEEIAKGEVLMIQDVFGFDTPTSTQFETTQNNHTVPGVLGSTTPETH